MSVGDWRDDWNYYDGPLEGVLSYKGQIMYYNIQDDADLDNRTYDAWHLEAEPTFAEDFTTGRPADEVLTEDTIWSCPSRNM